MVDGFEASFTTTEMKHADVVISQNICIDCCTVEAGRERMWIAKLIMGNCAFGAPAVVCAGGKILFRVVADENSEDGMAPAPDPITAHHGDSGFAYGADGL